MQLAISFSSFVSFLANKTAALSISESNPSKYSHTCRCLSSTMLTPHVGLFFQSFAVLVFNFHYSSNLLLFLSSSFFSMHLRLSGIFKVLLISILLCLNEACFLSPSTSSSILGVVAWFGPNGSFPFAVTLLPLEEYPYMAFSSSTQSVNLRPESVSGPTFDVEQSDGAQFNSNVY